MGTEKPKLLIAYTIFLFIIPTFVEIAYAAGARKRPSVNIGFGSGKVPLPRRALAASRAPLRGRAPLPGRALAAGRVPTAGGG